MGTLVIASLVELPRKGGTYLAGSFLMGFSLFLFSLSQVYPLSFFLLLCLGVGFSGFHNMQSSIILLAAAPEMRGRMIGLLALVIGAGPIGMLVLGALATALGALEAVRLTGSILVLLVVAVMVLVPKLRRF